MRLSYPSGPQHLPIACTFPLVSLGPFSVQNSGPHFCRAWLFYLGGGGGVV